MAYEIVFKAGIKKDLSAIDKSAAARILLVTIEKLAAFPEAGKLLQGRYSGLRSFRIGDYRVIYEVLEKSVVILRIAHRKQSYE